MNHRFFIPAGLWTILLLLCAVHLQAEETNGPEDFFTRFQNPPREFSVMPFWFWNDALDDAEIRRQIADFEAHGVYGFVIHPRIGLPQDSGWMSPRLLEAMRVALEEARSRKMYVILYDEGMYPSGSSAGQVAERNPRFAARGLFSVELKEGEEAQEHPQELWDLITVLDRPDGKRLAIYERPSGGVIRGLHYINEESGRPQEFLPKAGDIMSPEAVACFMELVYDRYYAEFAEFFRDGTVMAIFTDEPSELGRGAQRGVVPGNARALKRVSELLGYDFTPYLADLWYADTPEAQKRRSDYFRAAHQVLVETYYEKLSAWCKAHGTALCGHPGNSNDLASERVFQIPGQDIVWRYVEPGEKAIAGVHSTNAKAASSAMTNFGRTRNLNELYGAYGHNLTFEEVKWLAKWVLIRGQNLLVPHAFYYSVRGPRLEERPPDVGPNSPWWNDGFREYADACRRISWLNTGTPVIHVAILTDGVAVPDAPCRPLFENQLDFNYVQMEQALADGYADAEGLHLAGQTYKVVVLPCMGDREPQGFRESKMMKTLEASGRLMSWTWNANAFAEKAAQLVHDGNSDVVRVSGTNASAIRLRQERLMGVECILLFNEIDQPAEITLANLPAGERFWLNAATGEKTPCESVEKITFEKFEMKILAVKP
ncbi:MAG: hypothetical protein Q4A17_09925 [Thermoguttaceae bacterium]|nr:hypothetical protein [Thermoguttaceae bacterium]